MAAPASPETLVALSQGTQADAVAELEDQAAAAAGPMREQLAAITTAAAAGWVAAFGSLEAEGEGTALAGLLTALVRRIRGAFAGQGEQAAAAVRAVLPDAVQLGIDHTVEFAGAATGQRRRIRPRVGPDESTLTAVDAIPDHVTEEVQRGVALLTPAQVEGQTHTAVLAGLAGPRRAVTRTEAAARWATEQAVAAGAREAIRRLGGRKLWIAERDACVVCLAYAGQVVDVDEEFDHDLTFGDKPLAVYGGVLLGPPRHPSCRCSVTAWLGHDGPGPALPEVLKREARRSILRGWSVESESEPARLRAADRLLRRGAGLPRSVEERAARAVAAGRFSAGRRVPSP